DYDDTLIFSTPAFRAGAASGQESYSEGYWRVVNQSFNVEKVKLVPMSIALIYKALGFDVVIITARQGYGGEEFQEHWKWLAKEFHFERNKSSILEKGSFVAFFGDSDSDITEALEAGVVADLLAACEGLVTAWDAEDPTFIAVAELGMEKARAAIAKAKGAP
ncbi:hypothetical protein LCGC14_1003210, partial [marine sediment metagenome]